ncbi:hypothetical protein O2W15_16950 [Modestobacter sp. VKM Ac-2979]|uniref:hypothetical protein n=1 Tax=unclassified Modestobacter TaxID=2643866 RepID=UPI0022ABB59E|nr:MULTISPECIES: hypothetical protein [unclassified Modestobacter]MCZ2813122.1 hypothetical protein [Modestobacter sp. VKM Ac-2979]MCZ2842849.1 hypothetical protein [Modestobacter sp. VKM Ac-2980]
MTKNAIGTDRKTLQPKTDMCPTWCVKHDGYDQGTPDEGLIHYGQERKAAGYHVRLRRDDLVRVRRPGRARVWLQDEELTRQQAAGLATLLATAATDLAG